MAIRLGLLSLGDNTRLEFCHMVVDPGSVGRCQSVYSRPVGGTTGITPTHNARQIPDALHGTREWAPRVTLRKKKKELCQDRPLANSHPCQTHSALHHSGYTCLLCYLASILPPLHIASTQHVLLDSVGFFRHRINVVQAATGFTADEWYLELLQRPGSLEAHCGDKMWLLMIHNLSQPPFLDLWHPVPHLT